MQNSDTDSLLKSLTPPGFQLTHRPWVSGHIGSVGLFTRKDLHSKTVVHQFISLWKVPYQLSPIQNHLLLFALITHQVHVPLPFLMISCFYAAFHHLSLLLSSSVEILMLLWIQTV